MVKKTFGVNFKAIYPHFPFSGIEPPPLEDVKLLEQRLGLSARMVGARSKEESDNARRKRFALLLPLARQHPRYQKWMAEFLNPFATYRVSDWLASSGRSFENEWEQYIQKRRNQKPRKKKKSSGVDLTIFVGGRVRRSGSGQTRKTGSWRDNRGHN